MKNDETYRLTPLGLLGPKTYNMLLEFMLKQETRGQHPAIVLDYDDETGEKKLFFHGVEKRVPDPA